MLARRRALVAVMAVLTLVVLAGCSAAAERVGEPASHGSSPKAAAVASTLDFTAPTAGGGTFRGRQLAGKPALLWFWAPWCPTCRAQQPGVRELAETHRGELAVVGVGGLDSSNAIREYARQAGGFPHLVDEQGAVWRHFGVTAQSTFVLLDADADVAARGYMDDAQLAARVTDLVR